VPFLARHPIHSHFVVASTMPSYPVNVRMKIDFFLIPSRDNVLESRSCQGSGVVVQTGIAAHAPR
jgi:hypothetical protein